MQPLSDILVLFFALAPTSGEPRVEITPILYVGEPAPGIPDATITWLGPPQIDGDGNLLISGHFRYDGGFWDRAGLWYGGPGNVDVVAYEGMQAPDLPEGVLMGYIPVGSLSESGWIGLTSFLTGPGIVSGVNDMANFVGPPGDIRNVLQAGDPAPGLEPGTVIDASTGFGLTAHLSDNATLRMMAWLAGPEVDEFNDKAIWIGTRDHLELIWRRGMEAPGTDGARFAYYDGFKFNDAGEIAFRGGLVNEGDVDYTNDGGIWAGFAGGLRLVGRDEEPAPGTGVRFWGFNPPSLNRSGDVSFSALLTGEGVVPDNDMGIWVRVGDETELVAREGDPVPEMGWDVELAATSSPQVSARQEIFYLVKYRGDGIDGSNEWAMYLGPFDNAPQTLRDGEAAPHFPGGTSLSRVVGIPSLAAMNDAGDVLAPSEITGEGVTLQSKVVLWVRDRVRQDWFPVLRGSSLIDGRVVSIPAQNDLGAAYWNKTGGSDGERQSFNDVCQLAINLNFTDGARGVFLLEIAWAGDGDSDRDVDLVDFALFQTCCTGSDIPIVAACEVFDFDEDQDIDLLDYDGFREATTGPQ